MDFHPRCTKNFCEICHAKTFRYFRTLESGPRHLRPNMLVKNRLIRCALQNEPHLRRRTAVLRTQQQDVGFLRLPTEVRLNVYRYCIQWSELKVRIRGWYKGGGPHADDMIDGSHINSVHRLFMFAHRFTLPILLLNKLIKREAEAEIFGHLIPRVEAKNSEAHLAQLHYWFTESPFRLSQRVQIVMRFPTDPMTYSGCQPHLTHTRGTWTGSETKLRIHDIEVLASIFHTMPMLKCVELLLQLDKTMCRSRLRTLNEVCLKDENYIANLKTIRQGLKASTKLKLVINGALGYETGVNQGEIEEQAKRRVIDRLKGEGFVVDVQERVLSSLRGQYMWGI